MSLLKKIQVRTNRRKFRVRNAQVSRGTKMRISVHRSLKQIYAQVIDDSKHETVAAFSSLNLTKTQGDKEEIARLVGAELGKLLLQKNVTEVFFDRGQFLYHGRVKALAEGLRESGLRF